ncbi:putative transposase [Colletotrichum incanum]|nr:putative transposase [Colletotrichum incanum]
MVQQLIKSDLVLALNALKSDPKLSVRKAVSHYKVRDIRPPCQKLTSYEEETIVRYIINLDSQAFSPRLSARVLCEDLDAYRAWFSLVRNIITKYGIDDTDIYNFNKTRFAIGKMSSEIVVIASERRGKPRGAQQGNQEWVTVKHFDFYTRSRTKGVYCLLILDGHESHYSVDFELYCKKENIITLCFRVTGLVPYDLEYVISQLDVKLRTLSPLGSSAGLPPA